MQIEEVIVNRRSVYPKQMNGEIVPTEVIEKMLELANWAPNHKRTEPWLFHVYTGGAMQTMLDKCKDLYVKQTPTDKFNSQMIENLEQRKEQVSHIIAISVHHNADLLPEFEEIAAVAMAVQNMWLYLASTQKYGGYWSTPGYALSNEFAQFLALEDGEKCLGLFLIGTRADMEQAPIGHRGEWRSKVKMIE